MEEEEVHFCKNCKRDISTKNYVIHSVHCERKIKLCDRCLEPVPRTEQEKHEEEFHSIDTCSECLISVERWQIEKHKQTCIKRLVPCQYCELEVPLDNLSEHDTACGSRTEQCVKCKKHVMIKDLDSHRTKCSGRQTCNKRLAACQYCELEVPLDHFSEHNIACGSRIEQCVKCNKHVMIKDQELHHTQCSGRDTFIKKLARCEFCELEIPLYLLLKHSAACGSRTEQCSRCNNYIMIKDLEKHHANCLRREIEAVPCEYCGLQINWDEMMEHIAMCGARTERCLICNGRIMLKDRDTHFISCGKMLNFNESISCEYCGGTFNNSSIGMHVEFCRSRTERCNQCNYYIQREDMDLHHTICEKKKESRLEIPCQYCGGLFPKTFLGDHADICGTRLQKCEKCDGYIALKKFETHSNVCKESTSKTNGNCPVCHQSIPLLELNAHSAYCAEIFYETSENKHQNKLNKLTLMKGAEELAVKRTEEKRPQRHLKEEFELCPSCENLISEQKYHEHLLMCFNGKTQCHRCGLEIPKNYEHIHFRDCHEII